MPENSSSLIGDIARDFLTGGGGDDADIITFCEAPWGLGIRLKPVQKFVLKCAYGLPLEKWSKTIKVPDMTNERILYEFTETDFLKWLYAEGRCNVDYTEGKLFREFVWSIGRRAGKSTLAACVSDYETYRLIRKGDPSKHYGFPPSTKIYVLNVAPADDQADTVFEMTKTLAMQCPFLKGRKVHSTQTYFDFQTDADMKLGPKAPPSIIMLSGGCASNTLRGKNAVVVIMDEMAFFLDNSGRFSGKEVYRALGPSVSSFGDDGKVLCISSPYAKYGAFYERFNQSFEETDVTLMFKMYSAMMNPDIPKEILVAAKRRDRSIFMAEYGGEFSDSIKAWVEDENELRKCITLPNLPLRGRRGFEYFAGIDLGFKNDGTAVAIVHKEPDSRKIILDYADVWYSGSSDVWEARDSIYANCDKYADKDLLQMSDIVQEILTKHRWFPFKGGLFDQHNGYALAELLVNAGLGMIEMKEFNDILNSAVYQLLKRMYAEGLLELNDHPVLIPELLSLESEWKAKNKILVSAPSRKGAHDDISDAVSRAVWKCYNNTKGVGVHVSTGRGGRGAIVQAEANRRALAIKKRLQHGPSPRSTDLKSRMLVNRF